jgi:hypothetical protein|uniref:Uncharacterized protein n=1 Tax=Picea glauca TaxID=3330 RepID=A0A117NJE6_PICGL|nr:hypothetical protein ABT39_MTgene1185 [Picea glauca]
MVTSLVPIVDLEPGDHLASVSVDRIDPSCYTGGEDQLYLEEGHPERKVRFINRVCSGWNSQLLRMRPL